MHYFASYNPFLLFPFHLISLQQVCRGFSSLGMSQLSWARRVLCSASSYLFLSSYTSFAFTLYQHCFLLFAECIPKNFEVIFKKKYYRSPTVCICVCTYTPAFEAQRVSFCKMHEKWIHTLTSKFVKFLQLISSSTLYNTIQPYLKPCRIEFSEAQSPCLSFCQGFCIIILKYSIKKL